MFVMCREKETLKYQMESEECQIMGLEGFVLVEQREIVAKLMIKRFAR